MPRHGAQDNRCAGLVALAASGDDAEVESGRRAPDRGARPAGAREHRSRRRRLRVAVRPDQCDTDGAVVETERVGSDDVLVDTAVPALVDRAETVDQKVVADVVPAVPLHVVELDRANHRRCLCPCVGIRSCGVVNDREPHGVRVLRRRLPEGLVRVPACARDDHGPRRSRKGASSRPLVRALDQVGA